MGLVMARAEWKSFAVSLWSSSSAISGLGNVCLGFFYWQFLPLLEAGVEQEGEILQKRR